MLTQAVVDLDIHGFHVDNVPCSLSDHRNDQAKAARSGHQEVNGLVSEDQWFAIRRSIGIQIELSRQESDMSCC